MKIGFAGDWHGQINAVKYALTQFALSGVTTVAQVGDFGVDGSKAGTMFHDQVQKIAEGNGQTVYVTPGNHEDYDYINSMSAGSDGWCRIRENVLLAPRGLRWDWGGRSFVSLGGAASVDRTWRLRAQTNTRKLWWDEEAITDEDVQRVIDGGYADVMISHEAPITPQIRAHLSGNPHGFAADDIAYSDQIAAKLHKAAHGVMPALLFHGHHHFSYGAIKHWSSYDTGYFSTRDIRGTTRVIGLSLETAPGALAILDTETMDVVVS